jgi:SAM-dependent methyltransferase
MTAYDIGVRRHAFTRVVRLARWYEWVGHAHLYFAAGLLRCRDWRAMTLEVWSHFYHREEQVLGGLMDWEERFFQRFISPRSRVLVVGSGSGRDLIALAQAGHHVSGVEPCAQPIATARRVLALLGLSADIHEGFIEDVSLPARFDAIVFSYFCYAYIPGTTQRMAALAAASRHLAPGGRLLFSFPRSSQRPRGLGLTRLAARLTRSDWCPATGDLLSFPPAVDGKCLVRYEHVFTRGELEREAVAAGLRIIHYEEMPDAVAVMER